MPKKFTSRTRRSSSDSSRSASAYTVTIAFAQYVSMRPKRSIACSTTRATSSWTVWSAGTASASEPEASISATALSSAPALRAVTTTLAPRSPARRAIARPRPLEPPVTTTTCSCSGFLLIAPSVSLRPPVETRYPRVEMPNIGTGEIVLLLLLALLLFGAKRLPEIGRSLGKGMREFKDSVTGKDDDDERPQLEHLDELRQRLIISLLALAATTAVAFAFHGHLVRWLEAPLPRQRRHMP